MLMLEHHGSRHFKTKIGFDQIRTSVSKIMLGLNYSTNDFTSTNANRKHKQDKYMTLKRTNTS